MIQVETDKLLHGLVQTRDTAALLKALDDLSLELGFEDQRVIEAERAAHGGRLSEWKERRVSVRAVSGGLPSSGKDRG